MNSDCNFERKPKLHLKRWQFVGSWCCTKSQKPLETFDIRSMTKEKDITCKKKMWKTWKPLAICISFQIPCSTLYKFSNYDSFSPCKETWGLLVVILGWLETLQAGAIPKNKEASRFNTPHHLFYLCIPIIKVNMIVKFNFHVMSNVYFNLLLIFVDYLH